PPEPRRHAALTRLEIGLAETVDRDRAVPEQEDRLEVRARCAEQAQTAFLRAGVRALVRGDDAVLVWLETERGDDPFARPVDAVGAGVRLLEPPVRGLGVLDEGAVRAPVLERGRGLVVGVRQREPDDVVRIARAVLGALLRR